MEKGLQKLNQTDLQELLNQSINLYKELQLSDPEKAIISVELGKLALLRGEDTEDYVFDLWIEHFMDKGLTFPVIMDMIKRGQDLKKYGVTKLSVGDLIDNYEKIQSETKELPINWTQFLKILSIYEKKAMAQVQKLAGGKHITVEEYFKHKQYLENQFEKLYGQATEPDPNYIENLNIKK